MPFGTVTAFTGAPFRCERVYLWPNIARLSNIPCSTAGTPFKLCVDTVSSTAGHGIVLASYIVPLCHSVQ